MFRTKKDVDRHTQEVLKKVQNERERNLRCLSIAQQYYNVRDFESAKRYVIQYLSVKDDSSAAHKLLAQCHEQFNDKEKALQEYISSLQIDIKQPELILKVCELLADEVDITDKNLAKHWYGIGEKQFPYNPTILKLKKKLFLIDDNNYSSLEATLNGEVKNKPNDPILHTQLLTFYVDNGRAKEAYDEAFNKPLQFIPTIQWYQSAVKICKIYKMQFPNALKEGFYANSLFSLERLLALAIQDVKLSRKSIPECVTFLARFDETLSNAVSLVNKSTKFQQIINHMCGQLCFHTANILYRKLKWEENDAKEINQLVSPLLLLSTSNEFKISEDRNSNDSLSRVYNACVVQNVYRILQTGFVLYALAKESPKEFVEKIFHLCVANYWKEKISNKVYSTSDYFSFRKSSFFMTYSAFSNLPSHLPTAISENIEKNINVTENVNPISLHHLVWLGVNYIGFSEKKSLCDMSLSYQFYSRKFNSLPFSNHLASSYAESLCRIDVDAFLYASIFCAKSYVDQQSNSDKYQILTADVSKPMCSPEQEQWWECVHQMCSRNIPDSSIPRSRSTLQRGIEAVRLTGSNNSLPLPLLILLGRTFSNRAAVEPDSDKASALEERAALYWKTALPLLEKITRNEIDIGTSKSMFEYHKNVIAKSEAIKLVDEGKRIVGMHLIKENDYSGNVCDEVNASYTDLNSTTSSNVHSNALIEKMIQMMNEQNTKIMDKLDTLFNKQELLCSNQFQLLEMISTLAKKMEDIALPDCDEYLDKELSTTINSQSNFTQALQTPSNMTNTPKVQTNFPMNPYVPFSLLPTPPVSFSSMAPVSFPSMMPPVSIPSLMSIPPFQSTVTWDFNGMPVNKDQLESDLKALNAGSYTSYSSSLPTMSTPSFATNFATPLTGHVTNATVPQQKVPAASTVKLSSPKFNVTPEINDLSSGNSVFKSDKPLFGISTKPESKFSTVISSSPASSITSSTASATFGASFTSPRTSTSTGTHSYHIPVPDISSVIKSPPIEVPEDDDDDVTPVEHDPLPDFKPIIPLPDEIDVKTGEESEEVLYENRVKLYRFVDKEWKERGTGVYKLLKNPETGKVRALMRREMVHKVCANHYLSDDMVLTPMKTSDRAWIYHAADFADERVQMEQFCIKFKNEEESKKFFDVFNECKAIASKSPKKESTPSKPTVDKSPADKVSQKIIAPPKIANIEPRESKLATLLSEPSKLNINEKPTSNAFEFGTKIDGKDSKNDKKSAFAGFTGFSLNTLQSNSMSNLFQTKTIPTSVTETKNETVAPFSAVTNTIDFSNLSQSGVAFTKSKDFKGFDGAGSLVFGSHAQKNSVASPVAAILKNLKEPEKLNESSEGQKDGVNDSVTAEEEFVPTQEFKPVIPLPDLVEVKTGEEGLEVLYEERCKLFRFTEEGWKERGIGVMKILYDPTKGNVRLLMRREQVHKVCCNQHLCKDQELKPLLTNEKSWTWVGRDYSEGEMKTETLCVRFKTIEQAKAFKIAFDNAKTKIGSPKKSAPTSKEKESLPPLSQMFKRDSGSWECTACYVMNKNNVDTCISCASPKDPTKSVANNTEFKSDKFSSNVANKSENKFNFGMPVATDTKFNFGMPVATENKFAFGTGKENSKDSKSDGFKFTFGSAENSVSSTTAPTAFSFGSGAANSSLFNFGTSLTAQDTKSDSVSQSGETSSYTKTAPFLSESLSTSSPFKPNESVKSQENANIFDSAKSGTPSFRFGKQENASNLGSATKAPVTSVFGTPISTNSENTSGAFLNFSFKLNDSQSESKNATSQDFTPVFEKIPLLVNDKDEVMLFKSQAILYSRVEDIEKELGTGNLSILKNSNSKKFRLLMVGEPVDVVCLNHFLNVNIRFDKFDDNSWLWKAADYSRYEVFEGTFRVRFNTVEIAREFKNVIDAAQKELNDNASDSPSLSEVEFVSETKVTEEERKMAEKLQLPGNYYAYKYTKDCPGCVGCDEEDIKQRKENKENLVAGSTTLPSIFSNTLSNSSPFGEMNQKFVFGENANTSSWLDKGSFKIGDVFNKSNTAKSPQKPEDGSDNDDSVVKDDHDPYFEPVGPLPDVIEVKTGEEDEEIKFCERGKLFRYSEKLKEWKERGVGDLKILYHPVNKTYRLVMRREQIHKIVLNQRITLTLNLQPLQSSKNSWCWFGMNLTEDQSEPVLEKLAIRFKDETITNKFYEVVRECLFDLDSSQNVSNQVENSISDQNECTASDVDEENYSNNPLGNPVVDYHNEHTASDVDDERDYDDYDEHAYDYDAYREDGGEYESEYYVDEQGISEAMEELDGDCLLEKDVRVEVIHSEDVVQYDGTVGLYKRYDDEKGDTVASMIFSTKDIPAMFKADITETMNLVSDGSGVVSLLESSSDELEKKMVLYFENEDNAEEFIASFRNFNVPTM